MTNPKHPCRLTIDRTCPRSYNGPCPQDLCARFESNDEESWTEDVIAWERERRERDDAR
jgi:hypothetical protein